MFQVSPCFNILYLIQKDQLAWQRAIINYYLSGISNNLGQDSSGDGSISHVFLSSPFNHLPDLPPRDAWLWLTAAVQL